MPQPALATKLIGRTRTAPRPVTGQGRDRRLARIASLSCMLALVAISSLAAINAPTDMSQDFLFSVTVLGLAPLFIQTIYRLFNARGSNWLCVDLLTMAFYCIVHFAFIIYWLNGENPYEWVMWDSARAGSGAHRVCFTIAMCAAGLAAFGVGYHLLPDRYDTALPAQPIERTDLKRWRVLGVRLCVANLLIALIILGIQGPSAFEGGYKGSSTESGLVNVLIRLNNVLAAAATGCLAVASYRANHKWSAIGILPALALVAVVGGYAIHGDRNMPFNFALILAVAYSEQIKRISLWKCFAFMLIGMVFGTAIGVARISPQRTLASMYHTITVNSEKIRYDSVILELGYQAQPLFASTTWVPEKHPYYNGKLMALEALGILPFMARLPIVQRMFEGMETYEVNSPTLLTWVALGNFESGGRGTTSVADIYLNFGFIGVLIGMLCQGLMAKYLQQKSRASNSVFWGCLYAFIVPIMAYSQRAGIVSQLVETMIWPSLLMVFFSSLMGRTLPRRHRAVAKPLAAKKLPQLH